MRISLLTLLFCVFSAFTPAKAEAGITWRDFTDSCWQHDTSKKRERCWKRELKNGNRNAQKAEQKRERVADQFVREYMKLQNNKQQRSNYATEAQELENRKMYLELKRDSKGLDRREESELRRLPNQIRNIDKRIDRINSYIQKSGMKLAEYEAEYKSLGGRGDLVQIARQRMRQANRY